MFHAEITPSGPEPELACIRIPTATAIVHQRGQPFRILVGQSAKHFGLILPGGKIDRADLRTASMEDAATACIKRELVEEIGVLPSSLKLLAVTRSLKRDVRTISADSLKGTLVEEMIASMAPEQLVKGIYGYPDYLFVASMDLRETREGEELRGFRVLDCRSFASEIIGAGHRSLIGVYVRSLSEARGHRITGGL